MPDSAKLLATGLHDAIRTRDLVVVGILCLLVFLLAVAGGDRFFSAVSPDFLRGYHPGAWSIRNGLGYLNAEGNLITHWPPGYSILISPFVTADPADSIGRLRWLIAALAVVNVLQLYALSRRLLPGTASWITLTIPVLWPPFLPLLNPGGSEMLFMVLMNTAILIYLGARRTGGFKMLAGMAMVGVLLGAALLTRAIGLALTAAIVASLLLPAGNAALQRRLASLLIMLVFMTATLSPWLVQMYNETGAARITTSGLYTLKKSFGRYRDDDVGLLLNDTEFWQRHESPGATILDAARTYPASALLVTSRRIIQPWFTTSSGRMETALMVLNLPFAMAFLLCVFLKFRSWRDADPGMLLLVLTILAFWAVCFLTSPLYRYMAPMIPFAWFIVLSCATDMAAWNRKRRDQSFNDVR